MTLLLDFFFLSGEFFLFLSLTILLIINTTKIFKIQNINYYNFKIIYLNQLVLFLILITFLLILLINCFFFNVFNFF